MIHILFLPSFYSDPDKPVIGSFFKEQAQALIKAGVLVRVAFVEPRGLHAMGCKSLAESRWQITREVEDGVATIRQHGWNPYMQSTLGGLLWTSLTVRLIEHYVREFGRPDLIHAHNTFWAGRAAHHIWHRFGIPYAITEHSGAYLCGEIGTWQQSLGRPVALGAAAFCTVSNTLKRSAGAMYPSRSIEVIPNCVDTDFFSYRPRPRNNGPFVVLAVAHFSKNKAHDFLLRSFAKAFGADRSVLLRIGGHGALKEELIRLCGDLGITRQVVFLGSLSRNQVRQAMWEADAFVVSSYRETFGVVVIEAMATGLPVIATRSGGPEEIVTPETGILVNPGDLGEMAAALRAMRERTFESRQLRRYVEQNYSQSVFANRLIQIYEKVLTATRQVASQS